MSDLFSQRDNLFFAQADAQSAFDNACALRDYAAAGFDMIAAARHQAEVERTYEALIAAQDAYNRATGLVA